jgi:tetratricopeptide (TPR) repeat protein
MTRMSYDWDWAGAEREFRRAIEFNPSYATAHHWYSHYWMAMGRTEESLAASQRARILDPLDLNISIHLAWHFYMTHMYDHVLEQCRNRLEIEKKFYQAHFFAGLAYEQKGALRQAVAELRQATALDGRNPRSLAALAHAYGLAGETDEARRILNELLALSGRSDVSPSQVALVYASLGEKDRAFEWLERAFRDRCAELVELKIDPRLAPLRSDSRFLSLVRRVGFPQ